MRTDDEDSNIPPIEPGKPTLDYRRARDWQRSDSNPSPVFLGVLSGTLPPVVFRMVRSEFFPSDKLRFGFVLIWSAWLAICALGAWKLARPENKGGYLIGLMTGTFCVGGCCGLLVSKCGWSW
jgi:hypothetical protein